MSNYGVLVVESGDAYQIIAEVSSRGEALEMAVNYLNHADPSADCLPPDTFVIQRRNFKGWFTIGEVLADEVVNSARDFLFEIAQLEKTQRLSGRGAVRVDAGSRIAVLTHQLALLASGVEAEVTAEAAARIWKLGEAAAASCSFSNAFEAANSRGYRSEGPARRAFTGGFFSAQNGGAQ
jgi:hypothetical protein